MTAIRQPVASRGVLRAMRVTGAACLMCALAAVGALGWKSAMAAAASTALPSAAAASSAGAALVARIAGQLAEKGGVRTHFRQTQTLAALSSPLVSTGALVFERDRGVIWRIDTPYRVTYVIGDTSVKKIDAEEHSSTSAPARGSMAQVSRMMRALLGGDLSALYSQFDVAASGTPARWRLRLTPNQPQLAQFVKALRMEGDAYLQMLEVIGANGDTTRIEFSGSEPVDALTPAERALFGAR
ncbi:outer membrane lipoprotein carrier protein LolA [Trinickia sp. Y13]|uniref:outer membrane lipoprotein carrier protein LolA n=1 Tax=Trinickia sp. Y13 TaxID=2917807 RepID=UPI00240633B7|nr:outer membrane lipoprotein carrier protein LolA [Trinickia sp. Y13]MDG0026562.1 outer membrane lipoprotein carrier protein LolA [Trinickia sp. Y13]